jgi:two-component system, response regulator / RNA-binding antiterminator
VRILLADDDAARAGALTKVLSADPSLTILRPGPGELLADAVAALAPDVVLVDMARPDRDALEGIRIVASNQPRPIVLFVDQDDAVFMEEAIRAGVSSYNVLGVPPPDVKPILRAAAAMFRHHQIARAELRDAERRLHEREIVDRAKAILIKERRMGEPDAYRWLRTRAMSSGRRIPDIAREVVARENVQVLSVNPASAPATTQGSNTQGSNTQGSNTQGSYTQGSNTMGAEAQNRGAQ